MKQVLLKHRARSLLIFLPWCFQWWVGWVYTKTSHHTQWRFAYDSMNLAPKYSTLNTGKQSHRYISLMESELTKNILFEKWKGIQETWHEDQIWKVKFWIDFIFRFNLGLSIASYPYKLLASYLHKNRFFSVIHG